MVTETRASAPVKQQRFPRLLAHGRRTSIGTLRSRKTLTRVVPGWMVSVLIHVVMLLVLSYTSLRTPIRLAANMISVSPSMDQEELLLEDPDRPEEISPAEAVLMSLSAVATDEAEAREEFAEIELADNLTSQQTQIRLSDLATQSMPRQELLAGVAALPGAALNGRRAHNRGRMVAKHGGTAGSERAVALALQWFAAHQRADGSWSLDHRDGPCKGRCSQAGAMQKCFTGGTALALLPFLGAGQTHLHGKYQQQVEAGLKYLIRVQGRSNGSLVSGGGSLYSHGLAAIALCEAYAMTDDPHLQRPAQAALRYIAHAQDPSGGGWRYFPRQPGDTSVVGWQLMALKSGHMGKLAVPANTVRGVSKFLDAVQAEAGAVYGYTQPANNNPSMAAVGLLCRMYLGWAKGHPALQRGVQRISAHGPSSSEEHTRFHMYYNFYATQLLRHYGGPQWEAWNSALREMLIERQSKVGHEAGSWSVPGWGTSRAHDTENGGRLYYTSLATMILEVYYRHMPIYAEQAAEDEFPL